MRAPFCAATSWCRSASSTRTWTECAAGRVSVSPSSVTISAPSPYTSCTRCSPMRRRSRKPNAWDDLGEDRFSRTARQSEVQETELFGPYCRLLFAVSTPDLTGVGQLQYSTLPDWPRRAHDLPVRF